AEPLVVSGASNFIHASTVTAAGRRVGLSAMVTELVEPLKLKACPTLPAVKVTLLERTPLLPPTISLASTSPGHQLIKPETVAAQLVTEFVTPTPLRAMLTVGLLGSSLAMVSVPVWLPVEFGANCTCSDCSAPVATIKGVLGAVTA